MAAIEFYSTSLFTDPALKAYYRAEDNNDSSSNGKNLTETGTVNHAAAKFNNGFSANFTDTTNHLVNTSVYTPGTGDITLGTYFQKNGASTTDYTPTAIYIGNDGGGRKIAIIIDKTTGYMHGGQYDGSSSDVSSTTNVCDNVQHLLILTRIGTAFKIYVDGTQVGSATVTARDITGGELHIGFGGTGSAADYIGNALFDDIFVMSRGLSAAEITGLQDGTLLPPSSSFFLMF